MAFYNYQPLNGLIYSPIQSLTPVTPAQTAPTDPPSHNPYSPLLRQLAISDFYAVRLSDGTYAYCLKQAAGVALWWTLDSIADDITTAAISPIRLDPTYPAAVRDFVPDALFAKISMPRPEILNAVELDSFNPLYMLSSIPTIVSFWKRLQLVGLAGLAWIKEAKSRCQTIGTECGWDWNHYKSQLISVSGISYAGNPFIIPASNALGLHFNYDTANPGAGPIPSSVSHSSNSSPYSSPGSSFYYSDDDLDSLMEFEENENRDLVLHPIHSRYAQANPDYDVFSGVPLVNNGYVDVTMRDASDDLLEHHSIEEMDTDDDGAFSNYSFSSQDSNDNISSCYSFSGSTSPTHPFRCIPLPIVTPYCAEVEAEIMRPITATDLASTEYPATLRNDIVNA